MTRKNNSLSIRAIEGEIMPEEETYQAKLRQAVFDGVKESDVAEIIKKITEDAKAGDKNATKLFFDYVLGQKVKPTQIVVNNHFESPEQAARLSRSRP
jgi:hypothetical protein